MEQALLKLKEVSEYLGVSESKARRILKNENNKFTIRIGNRLYAHKELLDQYIEQCIKYQIPFK